MVSVIGCSYPTFSHPIVEPQIAKRFDELYGVYQTRHPDTGEISWLHIGRCKVGLPEGFHKFVWVSSPAPSTSDQGLTVAEYMGFIFNKGDSYIVQLPYTESCGDHQASVISKQWGKSNIESYCLLRLKRIDNDLRLDLLIEANVEKLVDENQLAGRIEQEIDEASDPPTIGRKSIVVTAESEELAKFFSNNDLDTIFEPSGYTFTKQIAR